MCKDSATCSQIIPMFQMLKKKLEDESAKPINAAFRDELLAVIQDLDKRFKTYKQNDFLILASLLDPRYVKHVEHLFDKKFKDFIPDIVDFARKYRDEDFESIAEQSEVTDISKASYSVEGFQFWDEEMPQTLEATEQVGNWEKELEVTNFLFYLLIFSSLI